jgi:hypothetical protein
MSFPWQAARIDHSADKESLKAPEEFPLSYRFPEAFLPTISFDEPKPDHL